MACDSLKLTAVLEQIRNRSAYYFPELGEVRDVCVKKATRRSYSEIYHVAIFGAERAERKIIVKITESAGNQFAAMKALSPHFNGQNLWKIPKPLDYLPEQSAFVMEEVSGTPLLERFPLIVWSQAARKNACIDCRRTAQWLRFYHDLGEGNEWAPLNAQRLWPGLDETLDELVAAGFGRSLYTLIKKEVLPRVERVVTQARPISNIHGDFTADNVLMDGESVVALDICAEKRNAIDLDIASFLNSLVMMRLTHPVPWNAIDDMSNAFLRGYFRTDECQEATIRFLQCVGLADIALEIVKRRRSKIVHFWVERNVTAALEKVITQLRRLP